MSSAMMKKMITRAKIKTKMNKKLIKIVQTKKPLNLSHPNMNFDTL
jgi:hypothetical protein